MTIEELTPLLALFGLLPDQSPVARPPMTKAQRRVLARVRKLNRDALESAAIMRRDVLNLTRGTDRRRIVAELVAEGHTEAAYLLTFNDDQLALLLAWRDVRTAADSSSNEDEPAAIETAP